MAICRASVIPECLVLSRQWTRKRIAQLVPLAAIVLGERRNQLRALALLDSPALASPQMHVPASAVTAPHAAKDMFALVDLPSVLSVRVVRGTGQHPQHQTPASGPARHAFPVAREVHAPAAVHSLFLRVPAAPVMCHP